MSTEQCRDIEALNPIPRRACKAFLDECKRQGVQIFITETYRSPARQNYLFEQGRTRPGQVVTWTLKSNHTGRMAWDIACSPPQKLYDEKALAKAGAIAKELGITWGGSWKGTKDSPHMEVDNLWTLPYKVDIDLLTAVKKLVSRKIITTPKAWESVDKMKLEYVPALLKNMGGVNRLAKDRIISDTLLWTSGTYKVEHVRSLIIKYAHLA